jgi:hypothetical protein
MKKILLPVIAALLFFFNTAYAQTDNNSLAVTDVKSGHIEMVLPVPAGKNAVVISKDAQRGFSSRYKGITAMDTYPLKDKSILFRFYSNGKLYKAFFSKSGVWLHTVCSYEEAGLPREVRSLVKRTYYDLAITFVDEVETPGADPVYRVQLQDDKKIVIVKVCGDEMEVDQTFDKRS